MSDQPPPSPLAAQALQRLQALAEGNGLAPDAIQLYSTEEKDYALEGTIVLSPLVETEGGRHLGPPRGHERLVLHSFAELHAEVERHKQDLQTNSSWIDEALAQLKEQPGAGWGLDDVKISLPKHSVFLAASEACPACQGNKLLTCPQCHGQGMITCPQCQGKRQELCHVCAGSGRNPALPDQPCVACNGLSHTACRFCHGTGHLNCPTCHGHRGTTCSECKGAGVISEEVTMTFGARTKFLLKLGEAPSGLRRGLDRIGIANLAKGHADIESIAPPPDEEASAPGAPPDEDKAKTPKPELHYLAHLPYADARMSFAGKKTVVGVFGKRNVLTGVPAFLDTALEKQRDILRQAALGKGHLDAALDARVMKDALKLQLAGKSHVNELRRIYPLGLSPQVAEEILKQMRLALHQLTLRARGFVAALGVAVSAIIFGGLFLTPLGGQMTQGWKPLAGLAFNFGVLSAALAGCWFALSAATRFALRKRFPDFTIPLTQKTGRTGYAMMAAIVLAFVLMLLLAPAKPDWAAPMLQTKQP
jgi:hypothetical protein